ncbi:RidA family protein [bacterium]|nr:RidA family protein [bacterium]
MNKLIVAALSLLLTAGALLAQGAEKTEQKPEPPFSNAVKAQGLVFVAGQIGAEPSSGKMEPEIRAQVRQALQNIKAVLEANGSGMDRVVKTTVFLTDIDYFGAMNEEYVKFFPGAKPARSTVAVAALARGALVEIEAVAVDGQAK